MRKIIYCLFALFLVVASIFVISDNINVGAWSYDNQGNLVSDNLFDYVNYNYNSIEFEYYNQRINTDILGANNTNGFDFKVRMWSEDLTYSYTTLQIDLDNIVDYDRYFSISFDFSFGVGGGGNLYFGLESDISTYADLLQPNTNYHIVYSSNYAYNGDWLILKVYSYRNYWVDYSLSNIMINYGSSLTYEPYGATYYSYDNYINNLPSNTTSIYYSSFNGSLVNLYYQNNNYGLGNIASDMISYGFSHSNYHQNISFSNEKLNYLDLASITWDLGENYTSNQEKGYIGLLPINPITTNIYFKIDDRTWNYSITAYYSDNSIVSFDTDNLSTYYVLIPSSVGNPVIALSWSYYYGDYMLNSLGSKIFFDDLGVNYNDFYNNGYNSAKLQFQSQISNLNSQINTLNNRIAQLEPLVDNSFGWRAFFFGLLDLPLKTITSFFDYELMGINLYAVLCGIITAIAFIWFIRKFWK